MSASDLFSSALRLAASPAAQAILLLGTEGGTQEQAARELAKALLCESPGPRGACGECAGCQSFERGTHPDMIKIEAMPSGQIILGQVCETESSKKAPMPPAKQFLRVEPLRARSKIVWFSEAERINGEAANALLKTLEEPPPYARIILSTSASSRILATVRSRCVEVPCQSPSAEDLKEEYGDSAEWAARMPHLAPLLFGKPEAAAQWRLLLSWLEQRNPHSLFQLSDGTRDLARMMTGDESRQSLMDALEALATGVSHLMPDRSGWAEAFLTAHRRLSGFGQPGPTLDALYARLLNP